MVGCPPGWPGDLAHLLGALVVGEVLPDRMNATSRASTQTARMANRARFSPSRTRPRRLPPAPAPAAGLGSSDLLDAPRWWIKPGPGRALDGSSKCRARAPARRRPRYCPREPAVPRAREDWADHSHGARTGQPVKRLPTPQVSGGGRGSGGSGPAPVADRSVAPGLRPSGLAEQKVVGSAAFGVAVLRSSTRAPTRARPSSRSSTSPSTGSPGCDQRRARSRTSIPKRSVPSTRSISIGSRRPAGSGRRPRPRRSRRRPP